MVHLWPRGQAQWEPGAAIRTVGAGRSRGEEATQKEGRERLRANEDQLQVWPGICLFPLGLKTPLSQQCHRNSCSFCVPAQQDTMAPGATDLSKMHGAPNFRRTLITEPTVVFFVQNGKEKCPGPDRPHINSISRSTHPTLKRRCQRGPWRGFVLSHHCCHPGAPLCFDRCKMNT